MWQIIQSLFRQKSSLIKLITRGVSVGTVVYLLGLRLQKHEAALRGAQIQLKLANEELERRVQERTYELSKANEELEAFSYSVSHDLRAPLRGIEGFSKALVEDYGAVLDVEGKKYLRYIRESVQKMSALIDDMLTLSKASRRGLRVSTVDLSEIAKSVIRNLQRDDPSRQVEVKIQEGLRDQADAGLIKAVIENFLSNSWKFTQNSVHPVIQFGMFLRNSVPVYFVRDNGAGFDMAYIDKLFGVFQRLHSSEEFQGTGVGLAIVQRVIARHGGDVWAEGAVGQGATFFFSP